MIEESLIKIKRIIVRGKNCFKLYAQIVFKVACIKIL